MFILLRYFTALLSLLLVVTGANGAYAREALTIDQIEDQIEKLKDRGKDEKRADLLYRLGEKYFESGKFESAAAKIKEAIEIEDRIYQNPSAGASNNGGFLPRVHSRVALANVYIQQKRFDQARDLYLDAIKILESLRFVWRRVTRRVVRADGPERIAPEWWTHLPPPRDETAPLPRTRDYYRVEDEDGRRYWIFREGLYGDGRGGNPEWFVQGLFA